MPVDFKLPDVGENVEKATVVRVLVNPGDTIVKDQNVLEIETDKATLEVPSSVAGKVAAVNVKVGQQVKVGQVVLSVDANGAEPAKEEKKTAPAAKPAPESKKQAPVPAKPERQSSEQIEEEVADEQSDPAPASKAPPSAPGGAPAAPRAELTPGATVPAAPSVRRLAREIGVDINQVEGSGPGGRLSVDDVKGFARERATGGHALAGNPVPLPDFSVWGEVERQPLTSIRKVIARRLTYAWQSIPHVHQNDHADITELEAWRKLQNGKGEKGEPKLTMTVILMKLIAILLKRYPQFNASYDEATQEVVLKRYYSIAVAVDTPRGLLVPVVRDVDKKSRFEIVAEMEKLAIKARDGKLTPNEMSGGTFTISNLGGIGGTSFDPIINPPDIAILGVARAHNQLALRDGKVVERLMLPLCLAYDHRIIDGAYAARFLSDLANGLSQPFTLLIDF